MLLKCINWYLATGYEKGKKGTDFHGKGEKDEGGKEIEEERINGDEEKSTSLPWGDGEGC